MMKTKKSIKKLFKAILEHDTTKEKKLYQKVLKKSLDHKKTYIVR